MGITSENELYVAVVFSMSIVFAGLARSNGLVLVTSGKVITNVS